MAKGSRDAADQLATRQGFLVKRQRTMVGEGSLTRHVLRGALVGDDHARAVTETGASNATSRIALPSRIPEAPLALDPHWHGVFSFARPPKDVTYRNGLSGGVTVAQGPLEAFVMVRIHAGQPQI